jgi:hypothetical protein
MLVKFLDGTGFNVGQPIRVNIKHIEEGERRIRGGKR